MSQTPRGPIAPPVYNPARQNVLQAAIGPDGGADRRYIGREVEDIRGNLVGTIEYIHQNGMYRIDVGGDDSIRISYADPGYRLRAPAAAAAAVAAAPPGPAVAAAAAPLVGGAPSRIVVGAAAYIPAAPPGPYDGLSPNVRAMAVAISGWNQSAMGGSSATLSTAEQAELRTWVEGRRTGAGQQKFVVNIGYGTGPYHNNWQFKVSGFNSLAGTSATYHITLSAGSGGRPATATG